MRLLARCLQSYFGFAAVLTGVRSAGVISLLILVWLGRANELPEVDATLTVRHVWQGPLLAVVSLCSLASWWQLRRGSPSSQKWAVAASLANLFWLPIGTVAGIVGLLVFSLGDPHRLTPAKPKPRFQPRPGDGTTAFSPMAFTLTGWGVTWAGFHYLNMWALSNGLRYDLDRMPPGIHILAAAVLSVVFHELGHVLGAWACEFSVRGLRLGPFSWVRVCGRNEFRMNIRRPFGGSTSALPTRPDGLRARQSFILAAGPVGSLLFGAFSLLLFVTALGRPWEPIWMMLELLAVFCLSDAFCNLMPVGNQEGTYSDGARLWQIALGGEWARYIEFALLRGLSITTDRSPVDWPSQDVEASARFAPTTQAKIMEHFLAYIHYRMRGEQPQSFEHMREMLTLGEHENENMLSVIAPEVGFYYAWYAGNPNDARQWLERPGLHDADHNRVLCAILGQEGDLDGARQAWLTGWRLLVKTPLNGYRRLDENDFALMAERWFPDLAHIPATVRNPVPALPCSAVAAESCVGA